MKKMAITITMTMIMVLIFFNEDNGRTEELPNKIEGCCGYKFGMTMEQASGVREDARWEEIDYGGSKKEKCLTRRENFFGEEGKIIVGFNQYGLVDQINIHFERFEGKCNEKLLKTIYDGIVASYGGRYLKSFPGSAEHPFPRARWQFPKGGMIELTNICIYRDDDDFKSDRPQGLISVIYRQSEGF